MIDLIGYESKHRSAWDAFLSNSKNGLFLFNRGYMEYHSDRFADHSIIVLEDDELVALIPANIVDHTLVSHGGLTFGGVVSDSRMTASLMLQIFEKLDDHLRQMNVTKVTYKAIPHIYHTVPAEEDLYALFRHNAKLVRRDISSTIHMNERIPFDKKRRWSVRKGARSALEILRSYKFETFMAIEEALLRSRYGKVPTHTAKEMALLAGRFPDNIKLFAAHKEDRMVAGVIMYESRNVAHAQYIAATDEGRKMYAVDSILGFLINDYYSTKKYFDFGISTTQEGRILNAPLIAQKEEFGARAVAHDTYEMPIS